MIEKIREIFEKRYVEYRKSLAELSYDSTNGERLCDLEGYYFFDYDQIVQQNAGASTPCTPDMIHFKNDKIIFVEFKNGHISTSRHKWQLKLKGIEGGFIALYDLLMREYGEESLEDITFQDILNIKKDYFVVYNSKKNNPETGEKSRTGKMLSHLQSLPVLFELAKYHKTFFDTVMTISEESFMEKIVPKL